MIKLISLLILSGSISAQAQDTLNIEEINERSAARINEEVAARHRHKKLSLSFQWAGDVAESIGKHMVIASRFTAEKIGRDRALDPAERNAKGLIQCVEKILKHNKGGYEAPAIAQKLILNALDPETDSLSKDADTVGKAKDTCWKSYNALYNFKSRVLEKDAKTKAYFELPSETSSQRSASLLVRTLASKDAKYCNVTRLKVSASAVLGAGVGVHHMKCLMENGQVFNYVGPLLAFNLGVGVSVELNRFSRAADPTGERHAASRKGAPFGAYGLNMDMEDDGLVFVPVYGTLVEDHRMESAAGPSLGFHYSMAYEGGISGRVFNSKRHWSQLVDLLK
jgi:hypothetical protein